MNSMAGYRNRLVHDPHMRRLYSKLRIRSGFAVGIAAIIFCRPPFHWWALSIALAGMAIRAWAAGYIFKNKELCTSGPYGLVRHPLYIGSFLMGLGILMTLNLWWLAVIYLIGFWPLYTLTMLVEEDKLRQDFREVYDAYAMRAGRWLPRWGFWRYPLLSGWTWERFVRNREYRPLLALAGIVIILFIRQSW